MKTIYVNDKDLAKKSAIIDDVEVEQGTKLYRIYCPHCGEFLIVSHNKRWRNNPYWICGEGADWSLRGALGKSNYCGKTFAVKVETPLAKLARRLK